MRPLRCKVWTTAQSNTSTTKSIARLLRLQGINRVVHVKQAQHTLIVAEGNNSAVKMDEAITAMHHANPRCQLYVLSDTPIKIAPRNRQLIIPLWADAASMAETIQAITDPI